jgi:hypothetical protein
MTAIKTISTNLDTLLRGLDPFGAEVFNAHELEISIEIPIWISQTLHLDLLSSALKVETFDGRLVAGIAATFARRAAAALLDQDADALEKLIDDMDHVKGWSCYHFEDDPWNDRCDDPDDQVRECVILSNIETEITFYLYLDGAGDLLYGEV